MQKVIDDQALPIREQILDAATQLIARGGVENTSLADIAHELGISRGTLFYYYPSKSQLIFDVTDRHFDQVTVDLVEHILSERDGMQPARLLAIAMQTILGDPERNRRHIYLLEQALAGDQTLLRAFRSKYKEWQRLIEATIRDVLGEQAPAPLLAQIVLAVLDGLAVQSLLGSDQIPASEIASYLIQEGETNDE
jgi:AcrR family transcriptional regulator